MDDWGRYMAGEEAAALGRYLGDVLAELQKLASPHNRGCYAVPLSGKDADLEEWGCCGIDGDTLALAEDADAYRLTATVRGHRLTHDFCEGCTDEDDCDGAYETEESEVFATATDDGDAREDALRLFAVADEAADLLFGPLSRVSLNGSIDGEPAQCIDPQCENTGYHDHPEDR